MTQRSTHLIKNLDKEGDTPRRLNALEASKTLDFGDSNGGISPTIEKEEIYKEETNLSPPTIKISILLKANPKRFAVIRFETCHDRERT